MINRLQRRALTVAAAALLVAGCSARHSADGVDASRAPAGLHARAAQRIELPGAADSNTAGAANAATMRRVLPEAPEVIRLPDGTVGVKVAAQYFDTVVACRQPDGSFGTHCPRPAEQRP